MANGTIFPAFLQLRYDDDGSARTSFLRAVDAAITPAEQRFKQFSQEASRQLDAAFSAARNSSGALDLGVGDARAAAASAQARAAAAREIANATAAAARGNGDYSQSARMAIAASEALAREEEQAAAAARSHAIAIEQVQTALNRQAAATGGAVNDAMRLAAANDNARVSAGQHRQGIQQLSYNISDLGVQFGLAASSSDPLKMALMGIGMQGSQVVQSLALMRGGATGFIGFLAGPWGAGIMAAVTVLGMLVPKLLETTDALDKVKLSSSAVGDAQSILGNVMDMTTGKINTQIPAVLALARAQLVLARVQAQTRLAAAKSAIEESKGYAPQVGMGVGGANVISRILTPAADPQQRQLASQYLNGVKNSDEAVRRVQALLDQKVITPTKAAELAAAYANAGIEERNLQVFDQAEKLLNGDRSAGAGLLKPKKTPGGKKTSSGAAKADRLDEFGEDTAARIADITRSFSDTPPAVARVADALDSVKDLSDDVGKKLKAGLDPKVAADLQLKLLALKPVIEESVNKPFNDYMRVAGERAAIDKLLLAGRQDEAEVLSRTLQLQREQKPLTDAQKTQLLGVIQAERARTREIAKQNELQQRQVALIDQTQSNIRDTIYGLFKGGGLGSIGDLFKRQADIMLGDLADQLTESLFGSFFRDQKDKALGFDKVQEASDRQVLSINRVTAALDKLAVSAGGAAGGVANDNAPSASAIADAIGNPDDIVVTAQRSAMQIFDQGVNKSLKLLLGDQLYEKLGKTFKAAMQGSAFGMMGAGLIGGSRTGGAIGGALGGMLGQKFLSKGMEQAMKGLGEFAGPLGGIVGGVIGGLIGKAFKKVKKGSATIGAVDGALGVTGITGNSAKMKAAAGSAADDVLASIDKIAQALGGTVDASAGSVSIGVRDGKYRVDPTGSGYTKKAKGAVDFGKDGAAAAMEYATLDLIKDGVLKGLRAGTQTLLKNAKDLDAGLQKAVDFESVFSRLKAFKDPVGAALDTLDREFTRLKTIFTEAGASAAEFADLEELHGKERAAAVKDAFDRVAGSLKSFVSDLSIGDNGLSLRDRQANARAAYDPLAARVAAGDTTAFDAYAEAAQNLLALERQISGSQQGYFSVFNEMKALSQKALSDQEALMSTASGRDSPFSKSAVASNDNASVTAAINSQTSALLASNDAVIGNLAAIGQTLVTMAGKDMNGTSAFWGGAYFPNGPLPPHSSKKGW